MTSTSWDSWDYGTMTHDDLGLKGLRDFDMHVCVIMDRHVCLYDHTPIKPHRNGFFLLYIVKGFHFRDFKMHVFLCAFSFMSVYMHLFMGNMIMQMHVFLCILILSVYMHLFMDNKIIPQQ